jgi:hypothetical protein
MKKDHPGLVAAVMGWVEKAISYQPPSRAQPGKDIDETSLRAIAGVFMLAGHPAARQAIRRLYSGAFL